MPRNKPETASISALLMTSRRHRTQKQQQQQQQPQQQAAHAAARQRQDHPTRAPSCRLPPTRSCLTLRTSLTRPTRPASTLFTLRCATSTVLLWRHTALRSVSHVQAFLFTHRSNPQYPSASDMTIPSSSSHLHQGRTCYPQTSTSAARANRSIHRDPRATYTRIPRSSSVLMCPCTWHTEVCT
jgi:hypothetical protein